MTPASCQIYKPVLTHCCRSQVKKRSNLSQFETQFYNKITGLFYVQRRTRGTEDSKILHRFRRGVYLVIDKIIRFFKLKIPDS